MKKKILNGLMVALALAFVMPFAAFAADATDEKVTFTVDLNGGTATESCKETMEFKKGEGLDPAAFQGCTAPGNKLFRGVEVDGEEYIIGKEYVYNIDATKNHNAKLLWTDPVEITLKSNNPEIPIRGEYKPVFKVGKNTFKWVAIFQHLADIKDNSPFVLTGIMVGEEDLPRPLSEVYEFTESTTIELLWMTKIDVSATGDPVQCDMKKLPAREAAYWQYLWAGRGVKLSEFQQLFERGVCKGPENQAFAGLKYDGKEYRNLETDKITFVATALEVSPIFEKLFKVTVPGESSEEASVAEIDAVWEAVSQTISKNAEKYKLANYPNAEVEIRIEPKQLAENIKAEIERLLPKGAELKDNFDITVVLKGEGQQPELPIDELEEAIKLTISLPDDLPKVKEGFTRTFYVFRQHGNDLESLSNVKLSTDKKSIEFMSDKFSDYTWAYSDAENPNTADGVIGYAMTASVMLLGLAIALVYAKKTARY